MPDGTAYFCIARTVRQSAAAASRAAHRCTRSALGCEVRYARSWSTPTASTSRTSNAAVPDRHHLPALRAHRLRAARLPGDPPHARHRRERARTVLLHAREARLTRRGAAASRTATIRAWRTKASRSRRAALTKRYPGAGENAVDGVDIESEDGEFLVLLGPSGSGKTTVLRMIAGLEEPTAGDVLIGGRVVNDLTPRERRIAMVFQSYALYPHLTVAGNIAFPLKAQGVPKAEPRGPGELGGREVRDPAPPGAQAPGALRRRAPARGSGARARARAAGVPVRRAALQPRRQAAARRRARSCRSSRRRSAPRPSTSRTTRSRRWLSGTGS